MDEDGLAVLARCHNCDRLGDPEELTEVDELDVCPECHALLAA